MIDFAKATLLNLCKVPPKPGAPAGTPESVRIFQAASNFYRFSLVKWGLAQGAAVAGTLFWLSFDIADHISPSRAWIGGLVHIAEFFALGGLLLQMPFTYFLVRLDYEMRWYIVTDRSLRIRHGVVNVREMTMTFANIQQMTIRQGPLQRLLGIADLQVRTAGGGDSGSGEGSAGHGKDESESMHLGYFRGVDNAESIRDLILERLRRFRDAGLGDPDDASPEQQAGSSEGDSGLLNAARDLLAETQALGEVVSRMTQPEKSG